MDYLSTRELTEACHPFEFNQRRRFSEILLAGLAPDGGLYLPTTYPLITQGELAHWRTLSYAELAYEIFAKFCDDIPAADLRSLIQRTYTAQVYCHARNPITAVEITPLKMLGVEQGAPLGLLELSNGPTLAFKDIALQLLGNLFDAVLAKSNQTLNILGATSGDTGSAAEYAMRGKKNIRVFMLSPHRKMSAFQTAQMYSLPDANIFNLAILGTFDDCQDIVKAVSNDHAFKARYQIGTVNSINWARVLAQVVYYFKAYLALTVTEHSSADQRVSFAVPSGNFGDIYAGHIARMMGLPIEKLVVATNENDVLNEFFRTGIYRVRESAQTYHTSSPSMDISKASNFERFIFDLVERDPARVRQLFQEVEAKGGFDLSESDDFKRVSQFGFVSNRSTHTERIATMRDVYARYQTVIDPHTADGLTAARRYLEPGIPMIALETAQPIKFGETIREALGDEPPRPAAFVDLEHRPQRFEVLPAKVARVKEYIATARVYP